VAFNKVAVLQPHVQELRVRNPTVITAHAKLFIEGSNSVFDVSRCLDLFQGAGLNCMRMGLQVV
jgi:hypothetical protein